ncbi:GyrI-like domain-containing protein [Microbacterium halotolerans]|uniref:GyrI-like domain-containing protein n=1 Tax=Microbacterium halotolerans TaxID=246613 RepID=UPI000E6AC0B0|nr:GyrI-like domain-containing protein [Microbacterium halotolerans]
MPYAGRIVADKIDFKKALDAYSAPREAFRLVEVPDLRYLAIDGHGDPNSSPEYADALAALYPVAYRLKFASKSDGRDYVVPPLEGLWWADDMSAFTTARDKSRWHWTMMLMIPDWIDSEMVDAAVELVGRSDPPARLHRIRIETLSEGTCVQTLHVGSFDDEGPVLARMHDEFIPANGLRMSGAHHEVYFSDVRRVAPDRMRTLLRQPVTRI